jgi:RNA polymerase sigma factor (sigma-70 family)
MHRNDWLRRVYEQSGRELYLTAWSVLREAALAEDAVPTAFVRLAQLETPPLEPKLYVFRCVRNAAIDLARLRVKRREGPLLPEWDVAIDATEEYDAEVLRSVRESIELLDASGREVIELHLHAELTFKEIAELLGEPLPTVASRYRRALDNCEDIVGQQYIRCDFANCVGEGRHDHVGDRQHKQRGSKTTTPALRLLYQCRAHSPDSGPRFCRVLRKGCVMQIPIQPRRLRS